MILKTNYKLNIIIVMKNKKARYKYITYTEPVGLNNLTTIFHKD